MPLVGTAIDMALPDYRFSDLFDAFRARETELGLMEKEFQGIPVWRLVRGQLFYILLEERKIIERGESSTFSLMQRIHLRASRVIRQLSDPHSLGSAFRGTLNSISRLIGKTLVPISFFTSLYHLRSSRKHDAFVASFPRKLGDAYRLTQVAEDRFAGDCIVLGKTQSVGALANLIDMKAFDRISKWNATDVLPPDLKDFVSELASEFSIAEGRVHKLVRAQIGEYTRFEPVFRYFLEKHSVQQVYLCWSRYYFPLLAAARKLNIPCFEFQHGIIGKYHIQYALPSKTPVPCFPDKLITLGDGWGEICPPAGQRGDAHDRRSPYS